jgi:uncharacterized protein YjdB
MFKKRVLSSILIMSIIVTVINLNVVTVSAIGPVSFYHPVVKDANGHLESWKIDSDGSFNTIVGMAMNWWKNVPLVNGWPAYCTAAELTRTYSQYDNGAVPACTTSDAILACLKYYNYTGDISYKNMAITMGNYMLQRATYPSTSPYNSYPGFPIPVGSTGNISPNGSGHPNNVSDEVMPDKSAMVGCAILKLYKATGNTEYLNYAINIANILADRAVNPNSTTSPWPFRVNARTGVRIDGLLSGNQSYAVRLYTELLNIGQIGNGKYTATRDLVWNWLKTIVIPDTSGSKWQGFFEDHSGNEDNPTQIDAMETARMLLELKTTIDPDWLQLAKKCINTVQTHWEYNTLAVNGFTSISEQATDTNPYNSHTARYASVLAMYYEACNATGITTGTTGGTTAADKDDAYHSLCYSAYSVANDGFANTYYNSREIAWTTDSFGDLIGHYMDAFGAVPEWAGKTSNHLLRSTDSIKNISYNTGDVTYSTYSNSGIDELKLLYAPSSVKVNGKEISTFSWDSDEKVLQINRSTGSNVVITDIPTDVPIPVTSVNISKSAASLKVPQTLQLTASVNPINASVNTLTWKSSNTKIATVSSTGKVKAKGPGSATITVTSVNGGKTATCKFTITQPVKSVKLNKTGLTLKRGKTYRLIATLNPANASNRKITWQSGNTKIATVSSKGLVKGIKKGTAYIYVFTVDGRKSAKCRIIVK